MENYEDYSIGVDLGTNSVGWAVIDDRFKVVRKKGAHMWGVRLFDGAETAVGRRKARSARRHYERRKERIRLLQMLVGKTVREADDSFFAKLETSSMHNISEDAVFGRQNRCNLFEGEYSDKDFYKENPTIYHLRKTLSESSEKADPRFIYLAMHHIIKYRGNFLYEGELDNVSGNIGNTISELFEMLQEDGYIAEADYDKIIKDIVDVLQNKEIPKYVGNYMKSRLSEEELSKIKTKEEKIRLLFPKTETGFASQFAKAVLGYNFILQKLFGETVEDGEKEIKIKFSDNFEKAREGIFQAAGDKDKYVLKLEAIYNAILFGEMLDGEKKVCDAMVKRYETHKNHLKRLKRAIITLGTDEYKSMFRAEHKANYVSYIKSTTWGKETTRGTFEALTSGKCDRAEFYKAVKDALKKVDDDNENKKFILEEIENGSFMPRLNDVKNGSVPYQFNLRELKAIIGNQRKYYPEIDENADKIISIMEFRRPYYVGVLNPESTFSWAEERILERVYPWNFNELVDKDKMAEGFIKNMTNKCSYFKEENVLPLNSIRYQSFIVLNELNKVRILDRTISRQQKSEVFNELFCKKKTVSKKDFAVYFSNKYGVKISPEDIGGLADEKAFLGKMSTLADFKRILGDAFSVADLEKYECAVEQMTMFNESEMRCRRLKKICGFEGRALESLSKIKYNGWGSYSKKLLDGVMNDYRRTVLQELYDGTDEKGYCPHINWLLMDKRGGFADKLPANNENIDKFIFDKHVRDMYCSPSVKREIWQALKVIEEITVIMGCPPKNIFIETTREDGIKAKTDSRITALETAFKKVRKEIDDNDELKNFCNDEAFNKLAECQKEKNNISEEKLFLYLSQMGKCMYSGKPINLDELNDCEVDHIIPHSFLKDDSLSNKALVLRDVNQRKSDTLALSDEVRGKQKKFWEFLLKSRLIGKKKYNSLMRESYDAHDLGGFINRQLVETSQTIKAVSELLLRRYRCRVYGVRAGIGSELRHSQAERGEAGFYKLRNLNDMHHAKDAYLAAVIGHFTTYEFPCWGKNEQVVSLNKFIKETALSLNGENKDEKEKQTRKLVRKRNSVIIDILENDTTEFVSKETGEILGMLFANIQLTMAHNDCLVTKKIEPKGNAKFYNETIYPKGLPKSSIPIRYKKDINGNLVALDTNLYGGYSSEKPEYAVIVSYLKGKNRKQTIVLINVPVMVAYKERHNPGELLKYILEQGYYDAKIINKAYNGQLLCMNGQYVRIVSRGEVQNATQLVMPPEFDKLIWYVGKADKKPVSTSKNIDFYNRMVASDENLIKMDANGEIDKFFVEYVKKIRVYFPLFSQLSDSLDKLIAAEETDQVSLKNLKTAQKLDLINILLKITKAAPSSASIPSEYGCGKFTGRLLLPIHPEKTYWIYESATGIFNVRETGV